MEKIIVSSCLLGNNTKYNGKNNYISDIELLKDIYEIIPICPEVMGGLSIPRIPSEVRGNMVIDKEGNDVTKYYILGMNKTLDIVNKYNIKIAILKDGSPSCGNSLIYDGTFSGNKINGFGVTAKELSKLGVRIYNENNFKELLKC